VDCGHISGWFLVKAEGGNDGAWMAEETTYMVGQEAKSE
jgi:hypothetical protein